jgi:hypothetical protein
MKFGGIRGVVGYLDYFLLLTRYAFTNNPVIASTASNPGIPGVGVGIGVEIGV